MSACRSIAAGSRCSLRNVRSFKRGVQFGLFRRPNCGIGHYPVGDEPAEEESFGHTKFLRTAKSSSSAARIFRRAASDWPLVSIILAMAAAQLALGIR
jgi:hypothetical protein